MPCREWRVSSEAFDVQRYASRDQAVRDAFRDFQAAWAEAGVDSSVFFLWHKGRKWAIAETSPWGEFQLIGRFPWTLEVSPAGGKPPPEPCTSDVQRPLWHSSSPRGFSRRLGTRRESTEVNAGRRSVDATPCTRRRKAADPCVATCRRADSYPDPTCSRCGSVRRCMTAIMRSPTPVGTVRICASRSDAWQILPDHV